VSKKQAKVKRNDFKRIAEYILTSYFYYKVCEGCESVILEHRIFCPLCNSYNFDYSFKRINNRIFEIAETNSEAFVSAIEILDKETC
jgi:hypothetical protein